MQPGQHQGAPLSLQGAGKFAECIDRSAVEVVAFLKTEDYAMYIGLLNCPADFLQDNFSIGKEQGRVRSEDRDIGDCQCFGMLSHIDKIVAIG